MMSLHGVAVRVTAGLFLAALVLGACGRPRFGESPPPAAANAAPAETLAPASAVRAPEFAIGTSGPVLAAAGALEGAVLLPRTMWLAAAAAPVTGGPAFIGTTGARGVVAVGLADYSVRAFAADDGAGLWRHEIASLPVSIASSPAGFAVGTETELDMVEPVDGSVRWAVTVGTAPGAILLATSRAVYVPTADGALIALSADTGERLWETDLDPASGAPACGRIGALEGSLYVCTTDGGVSAVRATDGTVAWFADLGERLAAGPAVLPTHLVIVTVSGNIVSVDRTAGTVRSAASVRAEGVWSAVPAGDWVYVADASGALYRIAAEKLTVTGPAARNPATILQPVYRTEGDLAGQPALLDSRIVLADVNGRVSVIDAGSGRHAGDLPVPFRVVGELARGGAAVFAGGADGTILAIALDRDTETAPMLSADRVWEVPGDGRLRMESVAVTLRYVPEGSGVAVFHISSTVSGDPLFVSILDESGRVLATNMGKVVLGDSTRTVVAAGDEYRILVQRSYPDPMAVVAISSEIVE